MFSLRNFVLLCAVVALCFGADDTNNLRAFLKAMCNANANKDPDSFGMCCKNYTDGAYITLKNISACFGDFDVSDNVIRGIDMSGKQISTIPSGVFSSLTRVTDLNLASN